MGERSTLKIFHEETEPAKTCLYLSDSFAALERKTVSTLPTLLPTPRTHQTYLGRKKEGETNIETAEPFSEKTVQEQRQYEDITQAI